jgi:hypothetical protein
MLVLLSVVGALTSPNTPSPAVLISMIVIIVAQAYRCLCFGWVLPVFRTRVCSQRPNGPPPNNFGYDHTRRVPGTLTALIESPQVRSLKFPPVGVGSEYRLAGAGGGASEGFGGGVVIGVVGMTRRRGRGPSSNGAGDYDVQANIGGPGHPGSGPYAAASRNPLAAAACRQRSRRFPRPLHRDRDTDSSADKPGGGSRPANTAASSPIMALSSSLSQLSSLRLGFAKGASLSDAVAITDAAKAVRANRAAVTARVVAGCRSHCRCCRPGYRRLRQALSALSFHRAAVAIAGGQAGQVRHGAM